MGSVKSDGDSRGQAVTVAATLRLRQTGSALPHRRKGVLQPHRVDRMGNSCPRMVLRQPSKWQHREPRGIERPRQGTTWKPLPLARTRATAPHLLSPLWIRASHPWTCKADRQAWVPAVGDQDTTGVVMGDFPWWRGGSSWNRISRQRSRIALIGPSTPRRNRREREREREKGRTWKTFEGWWLPVALQRSSTPFWVHLKACCPAMQGFWLRRRERTRRSRSNRVCRSSSSSSTGGTATRRLLLLHLHIPPPGMACPRGRQLQAGCAVRVGELVPLIGGAKTH